MEENSFWRSEIIVLVYIGKLDWVVRSIGPTVTKFIFLALSGLVVIEHPILYDTYEGNFTVRLHLSTSLSLFIWKWHLRWLRSRLNVKNCWLNILEFGLISLSLALEISSKSFLPNFIIIMLWNCHSSKCFLLASVKWPFDFFSSLLATESHVLRDDFISADFFFFGFQ